MALKAYRLPRAAFAALRVTFTTFRFPVTRRPFEARLIVSAILDVCYQC